MVLRAADLDASVQEAAASRPHATDMIFGNRQQVLDAPNSSDFADSVGQMSDEMVRAAIALAATANRVDYRGPDPYDGLLAPWPRPLIGGRRRRQALMQLHARLPVDVRRAYRRRHALIPKALGLFASVAARAERLGGDPPAALLSRPVDLLLADLSADPRAWGYHWDMQTRWSFYAAGSPNVVATAFAACGLLDAATALERPDFATRAQAAGEWALDELWVSRDGYFAYHPGRPAPAVIHNANLLGAWLVHTALDDDPSARARVLRAVERTVDAQRADGSWGYGDRGDLAWADSFHTGYVLTCLDRMRRLDPRIGEAVARGSGFYAGFFDARGRARLWRGASFPEDGHSAGTGLTTLAVLYRRGLVERDALRRVAARVLDNGLRGGHAVHRRYRWGRSTVRYLRWCDAHVALGLVDAVAALAGKPDLAPAAGGELSRRRDNSSHGGHMSERRA
jgi:hypothetical protein